MKHIYFSTLIFTLMLLLCEKASIITLYMLGSIIVIIFFMHMLDKIDYIIKVDFGKDRMAFSGRLFFPAIIISYGKFLKVMKHNIYKNYDKYDLELNFLIINYYFRITFIRSF